MSVKATVAVSPFFFSSAHSWMAPSIWRRLLIQAFIWEVVRALMKLGIAIAARRPMMATTIIISTRVNPDFRVLLFILSSLSRVRREPSDGGLMEKQFTLCQSHPQVVFSTSGAINSLGTPAEQQKARGNIPSGRC